MRNSIFALLFFTIMALQAQHTISGTFSPSKGYTWVIAYRQQPDSQAYIADTSIKGGKFSLNIPKDAQPGTYRLVYAVPQEEFYFDVLYNGKEDVQLAFDASKGVSFVASEENKIFNAYFTEINQLEQQIGNFYSEGKTDANAFESIVKKVTATQTSYEKKSEGLMAHTFIVVNRPYIPTGYESVQDYVTHKKQHYFEGLDVKDPVLQSSGFLTDKLSNYVFTALSLDQGTQVDTEKVIQENLKTVSVQLAGVQDAFQFEIFYKLWKKALEDGLPDISDFIYSAYLKPLATSTNNLKTMEKIEVDNRLRIGAKAPEITWKDGNSTKSLSALKDANRYLLIFWSSTCSHCLNELPPLHKKLLEYNDVKVIAIGLEDDEANWKKESAKLTGFEHVLALDHWDSEYAKLYDIHRTPTFFILDRDKCIITKPESDKEVVDFLSK